MKFLSIVICSTRIELQPFIPKIKLSILHSDCHVFFEISVTCSAFDSIFIVIEVIGNIRGEVLVSQVIYIFKTMNIMLSNDFTTHTCHIYSVRIPKEPCLAQRCLLNMGSFHSKHGEKRLCLGLLFRSAYKGLSIHFPSTISQFRTKEFITFVFRPKIPLLQI